MDNTSTLVTKLTSIGDAIRTKTDDDHLLTLDDMPQKIADISTAPFVFMGKMPWTMDSRQDLTSYMDNNTLYWGTYIDPMSSFAEEEKQAIKNCDVDNIFKIATICTKYKSTYSNDQGIEYVYSHQTRGSGGYGVYCFSKTAINTKQPIETKIDQFLTGIRNSKPWKVNISDYELIGNQANTTVGTPYLMYETIYSSNGNIWKATTSNIYVVANQQNILVDNIIE